MQNEQIESKYSVYFSLKHLQGKITNKPYVLIWPKYEGWNDFGHQTISGYSIFEEGIEVHTGEMRLSFLGDECTNSLKIIESCLLKSSEDYIAATHAPVFFTMQFEMNDYREIVESFDIGPAKEFLLSVNDVVAVKHYGQAPQWYEEAIDSSEFKMSFVRNSESYFAFYNAGTVLDGLMHESLSGVTESINFSFNLASFENEHDMSFSFDSQGRVPKRVAIVIGENGVGKSQSLSHLVKAALKDSSALLDNEGRRAAISRIVAFGTPGEGHLTFPKEQRENRNIYYRRLLLSRSSGWAGWRGIGDMLVQLARSDEKIKGESRWEIFCKTVAQVLPLNELVLPLQKGVDLSRWGRKTVYDKREQFYATLIGFSQGGEQACLETWGAVNRSRDPVHFVDGAAYPLSSGQIAFIRFAAQACLYIENGTLLLLDEPEIHLHPNLISSLMSLLDTLLEDTGSIAIIATHSVYFAREVTRSQVVVLKRKGSEIEIVTPRFKTLGADIGSISFFVFEDDLSNHYLDKLLSKDMAFENKERMLEELSEELSPEAIMELNRKLDYGEHS